MKYMEKEQIVIDEYNRLGQSEKNKVVQSHARITEDGMKVLNNKQLAYAVVEAIGRYSLSLIAGDPVTVTAGGETVEIRMTTTMK